jgi:hypothetical protein
METGFYLYCVRRQTDDAITVTRTISGEEKVRIIPYLELEAVTSEVSIEEFGSAEIQKKAEEDLEWIKGKALIHEEVVEQAMRANGSVIPVIPMQFGVIFRTKEKLQETLYENLDKFRESLDFLAGKQEWGVKAFMNPKIFDTFLENGNEELQTKKREAESLPKGLAFFAKKQAAAQTVDIKAKALAKITDEIYEILSEQSVSTSKGKILEKDFTRLAKEMVSNCFYLVDGSQLDEFKGKAEEIREKYATSGIEIEISGPWPSYHFA